MPGRSFSSKVMVRVSMHPSWSVSAMTGWEASWGGLLSMVMVPEVRLAVLLSVLVRVTSVLLMMILNLSPSSTGSSLLAVELGCTTTKKS